jgi:hypothetical protein
MDKKASFNNEAPLDLFFSVTEIVKVRCFYGNPQLYCHLMIYLRIILIYKIHNTNKCLDQKKIAIGFLLQT